MSMELFQQAAVIIALSEGKQILERDHSHMPGTPFEWRPKMGGFNFCLKGYRIKPEPPKPREWWAVPFIRDGKIDYLLRPFTEHSNWKDPIHVREVLPDEEGKA